MIRIFSVRAALLAAALLPLFAGCTGGDGIVPVSGSVTRDGKPVPNAELTFTPSPGRPSVGHSDASGNFKLQYSATQAGAQVGKHKVTVKFFAAGPQAEPGVAQKTESSEQAAMVRKYGSVATTPLEIEVKAGGGAVEVKLD